MDSLGGFNHDPSRPGHKPVEGYDLQIQAMAALIGRLEAIEDFVCLENLMKNSKELRQQNPGMCIEFNNITLQKQKDRKANRIRLRVPQYRLQNPEPGKEIPDPSSPMEPILHRMKDDGEQLFFLNIQHMLIRVSEVAQSNYDIVSYIHEQACKHGMHDILDLEEISSTKGELSSILDEAATIGQTFGLKVKPSPHDGSYTFDL